MAFYKYLYVVVTLLMQRLVCHALMLSDASYQQQSFKLGVRVIAASHNHIQTRNRQEFLVWMCISGTLNLDSLSELYCLLVLTSQELTVLLAHPHLHSAVFSRPSVLG